MSDHDMGSAPRELVLASAGAGKTFRLSSRLVGLLAAGVRPESILATTFTRKAAGEILDRVLLRLARAATSAESLAELNEHAVLDGMPPLDRDRVGALLVDLSASLHRIQVSTLDSFFHRVAGAFWLELGLAPGWTIADEVAVAAMNDAAMSRMFEHLGEEELIELLRLLHPGQVRRRVYDELLETASGLQRLVRDLDPGVAEPWGFEGPLPEPPTPSELEALGRRLEALPVPSTQKGTPNQNWLRARERMVEALPRKRWSDVSGGRLFQAAQPGQDPTFSSVALAAEWIAVLRDVASAARRDLVGDLQVQMSARGRLARAFDDAFREVQAELGRLRFEDVPHLLIERGALGLGAALYYRLDGRVRHLLLDEFQDTSPLQWRALEPLADEILSGHEEDRAAVVVADPKQSIYGWRGAEPALIRALQARYALPLQHLAESWRTAPSLLDGVNRVFRDVTSSPALDEDQREVAREWAETFVEHRAAFPDRPGHLRVVAGRPSAHKRVLRLPLLRAAVREVEDLQARAPGCSIGVLCRTRVGVTRMIFELRSAGLSVSEEGGGSVDDAWGVQLLLSILRMADRPDDRVARYLVATSPLSHVLGYTDWMSNAASDRLAETVRRSLVEEGYGKVLDRWSDALAGTLPGRDRVRMSQLVELAFRHDEEGGTLRPLDFVARVRGTRVEAPGDAWIRVMTIHASKGLEFDAVVLPELEGSLTGRAGGRGPLALPMRARVDGPVNRVLPQLNADLRPLFPEVDAQYRVHRAAEFRDELSALYVALTRARYALHVIVEEDREDAGTPARLVRDGLGVEMDAGKRIDGDRFLLLEEGEPDWAAMLERSASAPDVDTDADRDVPRVRFRTGRRRRGLPHRSATQLGRTGSWRVEELLRPGDRAARHRGTVVHAWLESMEWLESGVPEDGVLIELADRVAPGWEGARTLLPRFRRWLQSPRLRTELSRESFPPGTRVVREAPFLVRDGDRILTGRADRVLLIPGGNGTLERARVVDFKTESDPGPEESVASSGPYDAQLGAYRRAVASRYRLDADRVEGAIVYLGDLG